MPRTKNRNPYNARGSLRRQHWGSWKYDKFGYVMKNAPKVIRVVKRVLNSESKYYDSANNSIITTTASVDEMTSPIQQGDTASTRDGNSIKPSKLNFKGQITRNGSGGTTQNCRVIAFVWKAPQGGTPATATWFLTSSGVFTHYDPEKIGNFKILYDRVHTVDQYKPDKTFNFHLDLSKMNRGNGIRTKYNGNLGTYADMFQNSINIMYISSEAVNGPSLTRDVRLTYYDN